MKQDFYSYRDEVFTILTNTQPKALVDEIIESELDSDMLHDIYDLGDTVQQAVDALVDEYTPKPRRSLFSR